MLRFQNFPTFTRTWNVGMLESCSGGMLEYEKKKASFCKVIPSYTILVIVSTNPNLHKYSC